MRPRTEIVEIGLDDRTAHSIRNWLRDYSLDHYLAGALFLTICSIVLSLGWLAIEGTLGDAQAAHQHFELVSKIGMTVALIVPLILQFVARRASCRRSP